MMKTRTGSPAPWSVPLTPFIVRYQTRRKFTRLLAHQLSPSARLSPNGNRGKEFTFLSEPLRLDSLSKLQLLKLPRGRAVMAENDSFCQH